MKSLKERQAEMRTRSTSIECKYPAWLEIRMAEHRRLMDQDLHRKASELTSSIQTEAVRKWKSE